MLAINLLLTNLIACYLRHMSPRHVFPLRDMGDIYRHALCYFHVLSAIVLTV